MALNVGEPIETPPFTIRNGTTGELVDPFALTLTVWAPGAGTDDGTVYTWTTDGEIEHRALGTFVGRWVPDTAGTWRYQWAADGDEAGVEAGELFVEYSPTSDDTGSDTTPRVEHVARLLRTRTREDGGGRELGMFTDNTTPTRGAVQDLITEAGGIVDGELGDLDDDSPHLGKRRRAITLLAAVLIEDTYFSEQVEADRSPRGRYWALYERLIAAILQSPNDAPRRATMVSLPIVSPYTTTDDDAEEQ